MTFEKKPFYVKIEVMKDGKILTTYWYHTDCRTDSTTVDIPIVRIVEWLAHNEE